MGKITYTNKVALNENPEIADINKVTDDDMNEIKSVVNTNDDNVGDITTLTTTTKTSTVSAINELNSTKATSNDLGNIANLTTTDKTSVVNAVNELNSNKASKNEVIISDTQPSASDNKLWIDTSALSQSDETNMKYNDNGTYKDIYVKSFDTLPVGTEVDYDGQTVPTGWTEIQDYSTNEIDTGKVWIDGKKIYRKVISNTIGTTNGAWKSIQAFDANYIDTIISMSGTFVYNVASKSCYTFPFLRATDNSFANREYVLNNCNIATGVVSVIAYHPHDYSFMSGQPIILIIEYTKA